METNTRYTAAITIIFTWNYRTAVAHLPKMLHNNIAHSDGHTPHNITRVHFLLP